MIDVTPEELIEFVRTHDGMQLETQQQKRPFTVHVAGDSIEYMPQTGKLRPHELKYLQRVCDEFSRINSFRPVDYNDITMNASYTLALIRAYLDSKHATS
jgi:hypothetical protein